MEKKYKECDRDQMYFLPPSLHDWLPEGHLAYFIIDVVNHLDLSEIHASYGGDGRGQPPYDPSMMVSLLFYAYCVGIPSSRRIERATIEDVAFRVVSGNRHPDHDSICAFRKRHLNALAGLFLQVLKLCREAGLVKLGHVALDGTKVHANASRHKAMSYGRMKKEEERLEREVRELLRLAEETDEEEDRRYGQGIRGDELPEELRHKESRLKKIREARAALEEKARERAREGSVSARKKREEREKKEKAGGKKRRGRKPVLPDPDNAKPDDKAQRNFTDPDSRIMVHGGAFEQCYNAQAAVVDAYQVIVACGVTNEANDKGQMRPMVAGIEANVGGYHGRLSADAGYYSEKNVTILGEKGIDGYLAVRKIRHGEAGFLAEVAPPEGLSIKGKMDWKLRTQHGREVYGRRKCVVEPVFGQIKGARGLRQFLLRGIENVYGEWSLWCLTHNLLKLYRFGACSAR